MYKEVALDPQCMAEYHYYGLLKTNFGFEKGRYVIAPVRDWVKEAYQAVKNSDIQIVKRKSVTSYLNKLQKSRDDELIILPLYRATASSQPYVDWVQWLAEQQQVKIFGAVVSERLASHSINHDQILNEHADWVISPTVTVNKTAREILGIIAPLLQCSNELMIVDQYFSLASNNVLKAIFTELQTLQTVKSITLVTSVITLNPEVVFQSEFSNRFAFVPEFKLVVAPAKFFHDRYMITDNGAIKAGCGFSEGVVKNVQADALSISFCGKAESQTTKDWVNQGIADGRINEITLAE